MVLTEQKEFEDTKEVRDRPFNLKGKGGYGFLFRSEKFFFGQHKS